ncbi:efflux RND transporter periplasmic adaptor subunit [Paenibacillus endoradicis]|uniref:efflux RND transporter periplasmic adaptor subunit n=1 Tax=Paenibacillus endoradicis TaxID=2972487 RepID=UPI0021599E5D|nr:biotin/lipoyl-binding protein [Paenibacillus endoradicis]MCR8656033.1 biotin/lipoyl-binding protein [Paenibacillus endoradicis]MCR8658359.1 biotin/lipoyl-binding protein [Paenibacillus endoradicis]
MFMKWWMANLSRKASISMVILALLLSGCSLLPNEKEEEVIPDIIPPKISQKPEYTVATKTLESAVTLIGKIISLEEETMYFTKGDLNVKDVYVKSGDTVTAGQLIAELDVSELQKTLRLERLAFQRDELAMKELLRTRDEMDQADYESQRIAFEEKRQKLSDMEVEISKGAITAPFSGTIVSLTVKKGDLVKAYAPIAIVANTSLLVPGAKLTKTEQEKVAIGMEATVSISNGGSITGKIKQLPNKSTESSSGGEGSGGAASGIDRIEDYMIVQIDKLPEGAARGLTASIKVVTSRTKDAIVIPPSALRSIGNRTYVQVVDKDGKREVDVEVGQQTPTDVEILQGLTPGQKVVGR